MYLLESLQYALTPTVRLVICLALGGALILIHRWDPERKAKKQPAGARNADLLAVYPGHSRQDAYRSLMGDRIDAPIVTPDSHPTVEKMQNFLDAMEKEGVKNLDRV